MLQLAFMRVAIQGQAGSFHHQAAKTFFGSEFELIDCHTFRHVFEALSSGKAEAAVAAIENSLYGSINPVYDLLIKNKFWISGEIYLRIEHCLIGLPGANIADIKEVHSQAEALAQCEDYIDTNLPNAEKLEHHDTAASARDIKKWGDKTKAAIASKRAAKLYDLPILAHGIEDNKENYTRFVILYPSQKNIENASKTSLVLTTKSDTKAGSLHSALGVFAKHDTNLTMLQSRPIVGKAWHYVFYVDLEISTNDPIFNSIISELQEIGYQATILGSYKAGDKKINENN